MENCVDPCSAVAPFMRAMECIPEDDENADLSSASLLSSIRNLKRGGSKKNLVTAASDNNPNIRLQNLKMRLETFLSNGWLTKHEHQQYVEFLSTFDIASCIGANGKYALKELEKELDSIEEEKSSSQPPPAPQSWSDMFMSTLGVSTSSSSSTKKKTPATVSVLSSANKMMGKSMATTPLATATNRVVNGAKAPTIVNPKDLSNCLTEDAIAEIFVETCFFARLGFVQPPCCMSCTYKEALKDNIPDLNCKKWVIWRKNANKTFDPSNNINLSDNAIAVQCKTARQLISGKMVESYQWEKREKRLDHSF